MMESLSKIQISDQVLKVFEDYLSKLDNIDSFVDHLKFLGFFLANNPGSSLFSPVIDHRIEYFRNKQARVPSISVSPRTLHVATQLYLTGGHTRVIENWINFTQEEKHDIVLTNQYRKFNINIPKESKILELDDDLSNSQKIDSLNELYIKYDKIIFHIHQHDTIPLIAMAHHSNDKFFFYNHADHTFSIGPSLVGEVYDMSEKGRLFSLNFRGVKSSKVIPFPIAANQHNITCSKDEMRKKLGLKADSKIILSVGTDYKFIPNNNYNLFKSFEEIALHNKNFIFVFIGPDQSFDKFLSNPIDNIKFLGLQPKNTVRDYYIASDLYIDSLPVSGGLALIEGMLSGLPIITFDNGFNAFDAAVNFRTDYGKLQITIENYMNDKILLKELKDNCLRAASRHQKGFWKENFDNQSLTLENSKTLTQTELINYCEALSSKFPPLNVPRVGFKLSNEIFLKLNQVLPKRFLLKVFIFQSIFPIIKKIISIFKDRRA